MKIIRYQDPHGVIGFAQQLDDGSSVKLPCENDDVTALVDFLASGDPATHENAVVEKILAPVRPPIIIGIGLNYRAHAAESGLAIPEYPVVFMKTAGAVQNPDDPIEIPTHLESTEVDYECELGVVIGKTCKNVGRAEALDVVLGYTCANDVSARDWQIKRGGSQWSRGKTFDTFAPLGPYLVTKDEIPNPGKLQIRTLLNGKVVQDSNTSDMIFDVAELVTFLSGSTTLQAGTVLLTGTPQGVGMAQTPPRYLRSGDTVVVDIEGIGELRNPVFAESEIRNGVPHSGEAPNGVQRTHR